MFRQKAIGWPLFWCLLSVIVGTTPTTALGKTPIDFNEQIRPIFTRHCTACHGGVKAAGDVSFVTGEAVSVSEGWIVEPGEPNASILIERVESTDPDVCMPPPEHGPALNPAEIQLLRDWIEQGATWESHWAFQELRDAELPRVADDEWPISSFDHFVLNKLESLGIPPSSDATPSRWLRRVTLDLTGLPPTPMERTGFLSDLEVGRGDAYSRVVDRLLASPAYGERWASVWLDQVRYADSKGLGLDGVRNVWKYRDWVIRAWNDDMPYDQFTIKQMAGDLLPDSTIDDLVATAAHRLTQTNEEGGTDDEEFRVAAVLDRVNTTWQTWQGITFGCTQCHSHPYDPFTHEEYYRFAAFFNNTQDVDLNDDWPTIAAPLQSEAVEVATELDRGINSVNQRIWEAENELIHDNELWRPVLKMSASTNNDTQVIVESKPECAEYRTVDTVSSNTTIQLEFDLPNDLNQITAVRFTGMPLDPVKAITDSEWGFILSHFMAEVEIDPMPAEEDAEPEAEPIKRQLAFSSVFSDDPTPHTDPMQSLNAKSKQGFAAFSRIHYPRSAAFVLSAPLLIEGPTKMRLSLRFNELILAAFPLVARRGQVAISDQTVFQDLLLKTNSDRTELKELRKKRKAIPSTSTPVLRERRPEFGRTSNVFIRGNFLTKGEPVTPGTPKSLPPLFQEVDRTAQNDVGPHNTSTTAKAASTPSRLDLAYWLVSKDNPLTARVHVNRIWARLFGIGLVATEEDFGTSGERPSHPKLLDHLAYRFQGDMEYRSKLLIREIVLSRTYRQSSAIREELLEQDSQNRLLARGPRHRLPAEIIRDQSLAIAGLLSDEIGGPPVRPSIPEGVWNPFAAGDKWKSPEIGNAARYRRSIYTYTKRSIPYPMFASFDAPSRELCSPRRLRSNTPLQSLVLLNDETFDECASGLANRMQEEASHEIEGKIRFGFVLACCREPNESELAALMALWNTYPAEERDDAMRAIATVLLNLDETLTK